MSERRRPSTDAADALPSAHARAAADEIWEAQHNHPFVRGIGAGTLDIDRFSYWVRQDYVYLKDYVRVLAYAAAKAPTIAVAGRFAELSAETANTEMGLHRQYATEFGISAAELEAERPEPVTAAYTDFLLRHAAHGGYGDLIAALLPCMWGFSEIGQRLDESERRPADARHATWVEMYASPDFARLADWCRVAYDDAAFATDNAGRARMQELFVLSSRHELAFWQAAWDSGS